LDRDDSSHQDTAPPRAARIRTWRCLASAAPGIPRPATTAPMRRSPCQEVIPSFPHRYTDFPLIRHRSQPASQVNGTRSGTRSPRSSRNRLLSRRREGRGSRAISGSRTVGPTRCGGRPPDRGQRHFSSPVWRTEPRWDTVPLYRYDTRDPYFENIFSTGLLPRDSAYGGEVAFPGGVHPRYIRGAEVLDPERYDYGTFIPNPNFDPHGLGVPKPEDPWASW
jgi:hypothetical protein